MVAAQGSPESPDPSPGSPSPVFEEPEGDASTFMGFYSLENLVDLENSSRELRRTEEYVMADPEISDNLPLFLKYTQGAQWQYELVHPSLEVLLFQLRAYLKGFELRTRFNR